MRNLKLSDYVIEFLKEQGVHTIFGYQGGAITHLIDSIGKTDGVSFLSSYHEQGAAFAAEGYARVTNNIGVAMATSGPGATNLITGIGSAYFDSIPCLYLTGQVNTYEYKKSDGIRQVGFQETDIVSIVKPIVKFAKMIVDSKKIRFYLEKAVYLAKTGRPGPVLLDIPMDIQRAEVDIKNLCSYYDSQEYKDLSLDNNIEYMQHKVIDMLEVLKDSERPVILTGGGVRTANATEDLLRFIHYTHIPVVSTLMGLDGIDHQRPEFVGFIGAYGNRYANLTIANADVVIVMGSRLTSRQTSPNPNTFAREARIIHIDIDKHEMDRAVKSHLSIQGDLRKFLKVINETLSNITLHNNFEGWLSQINNYKKQYPSYPTQQELNAIDPNKMMKIISSMLDGKTIICTDVGQNQMWVAQSFEIKHGQRLLNSGGMGAMGFALPSAIGAYKASPDSTIIAIAGDGGIQMNIQELQTIVREKMPIKIFVVNNKALGMIRHFQEMYFDSCYLGTIDGYNTPDFIKLGEAYGILSYKISSYEQLWSIKDKLEDNYSYLFEIDLNNITYVIPKLSMGRPIEDQDPVVSREELKSNMIIPVLDK